MGPVPRRIESASLPDLEVIHTETHMNRRQPYENLKEKISPSGLPDQKLSLTSFVL